MSKPVHIITRKELESHNKEGDGWIVINDDVFDMSKFYTLHPGGDQVLRDWYGKDATEAFYGLHRHEVLEKYMPRLLKGRIEGASNPPVRMETASDISMVPFAEAPYFRGESSPFWKPEHMEFRKTLRIWIQSNLKEDAERCERTGEPASDEIFKKMADYGLLAMRIGPGEHLKHAPNGLPLGIKNENFDYFYEMIVHEELGRTTCPGFVDSCGSGMVIGLPPLVHLGTDWMKNVVVPEILHGKKRICLAITEPTAGSDVANVSTTAQLTPDGKFYLVNGNKKWITNGCESQYFTTLVRTGGKGAGGLTMLLIERGPGVETTRISTSYSKSAGTAFIQFRDVLVPVENVIGGEGSGFLVTMQNFVHERWMIIVYIVSSTRGILGETLKWCNQRKAFGKNLLQQPAVRQTLARMIAEVECVSAALELFTYQMNLLDAHEIGEKLAGKVSLLKYQATRVAQQINEDAVSLFGGRAITANSGMGYLVERFNRTNRFAAILGGTDMVLKDAGVRMSLREFPENAKL